jgi:hypothetical protein
MQRTNEDINQIIEDIRSLRVQAEDIRHQEDQLLQELSTLLDNLIIGNTPPPPPIPANVVEIAVATPVNSARDLQPGDRVRITNSISRLIGSRAATEEDRTCTVTRVTTTRRVLITTDTGINTWRYSTNLHFSPRNNE